MMLGCHFGWIHGIRGIQTLIPSSLVFAYLIIVAIAFESPGHLSTRGRLDIPCIFENPSGAIVGSSFIVLPDILSLKQLLAALHIFLAIWLCHQS